MDFSGGKSIGALQALGDQCKSACSFQKRINVQHGPDGADAHVFQTGNTTETPGYFFRGKGYIHKTTDQAHGNEMPQHMGVKLISQRSQQRPDFFFHRPKQQQMVACAISQR